MKRIASGPRRQLAELVGERPEGAQVRLLDRGRRFRAVGTGREAAEADDAGRVVDPGGDPLAAAQPQLDRHGVAPGAGGERGAGRRVPARDVVRRAPGDLRGRGGEAGEPTRIAASRQAALAVLRGRRHGMAAVDVAGMAFLPARLVPECRPRF